jgi:hypothetical protein
MHGMTETGENRIAYRSIKATKGFGSVSDLIELKP